MSQVASPCWRMVRAAKRSRHGVPFTDRRLRLCLQSEHQRVPERALLRLREPDLDLRQGESLGRLPEDRAALRALANRHAASIAHAARERQRKVPRRASGRARATVIAIQRSSWISPRIRARACDGADYPLFGDATLPHPGARESGGAARWRHHGQHREIFMYELADAAAEALSRDEIPERSSTTTRRRQAIRFAREGLE